MDIGIVSRRYAKALVKYSESCGQLNVVYEAMIKLRDSFVRFPEMKSIISNPVISNEKKKRLLMLASAENLSCLEEFLNLVLSKNRIEMTLFITQAFIDLYRAKQNITFCHVTAPSILDSSVIDKMRTVVEKQTNKHVEMEQDVDTSLIGGFILEYDSRCLDASVKGTLRKIHKQLAGAC